jgi:hypothetical protein
MALPQMRLPPPRLRNVRLDPNAIGLGQNPISRTGFDVKRTSHGSGVYKPIRPSCDLLYDCLLARSWAREACTDNSSH